jgi:hypothetical protein
MAAAVGKGCRYLLSVPRKIKNEGCKILMKGIGFLCQNPFCSFVTVAVILNVPPITCCTSSLNNGFQCKAVLWQTVNASLCCINIIAAFYIFIRFKQLQDDSSNGRSNLGVLKQAHEILCYDIGVAIYILFLVGFVACLSVGVHWRAGDEMNCAYEDTLQKVGVSLGCGFLFLSFGFFTLGCSIIRSCCRRN